MLPFDVDLASSGFTDGTGERTGGNEMRTKCARQFMAILMPCLDDAAILDVVCRMSVSDLCAKNPRAAQNFLKDRVPTCSNRVPTGVKN